MNENRKVIIIGGGITGLACAHRLLELKSKAGVSLDILLLEASSRLGGTIETERRDEFVIEKGPDCFISEKPGACDLSKRLGLDREIIGTTGEHRRSFVAWKNRLIPIPEGFYLIAPRNFKSLLLSSLFSPFGKLRMAADLVLPKREEDGDESIGSFVRRRLGREALERIAQPILAGIYTGDPDRLSLKATVPRFAELESTYGSIIRGLFAESKKKQEFRKASGARYGLFLSYKKGMEELTRTLAARLSSGVVSLRSEVMRVRYDANKGGWRVFSSDRKEHTADVLCLAVPAHRAGEILSEESEDLSRHLSQIPYESVATVNFVFERAAVHHPLDGFGFVVPAVQNLPLIACSFSSVKFSGRSPAGFVLLRAFAGGVFGRRFFDMDDEDLEKAVLGTLSKLLGTRGKPCFSVLSRYPKSMPQYCVGHVERASEIRRKTGEFKNLFLVGSAYFGSGISDCISDAERQAEQMFENVCMKHHASVCNELVHARGEKS